MNKRIAKALSEHTAWLEARGLTRSQIRKRRDPKIHVVPFPDYSIEERIPLGNKFANSGFVNTMMAKRFTESPKVRKEIEDKATRIAPAFNKAGYSYISNVEDAKYIGKK
jgi:hypothetical protein